MFDAAESAFCVWLASSRPSDVHVACGCHTFVLLVLLLSFANCVASGGSLFFKKIIV